MRLSGLLRFARNDDVWNSEKVSPRGEAMRRRSASCRFRPECSRLIHPKPIMLQQSRPGHGAGGPEEPPLLYETIG